MLWPAAFGDFWVKLMATIVWARLKDNQHQFYDLFFCTLFAKNILMSFQWWFYHMGTTMGTQHFAYRYTHVMNYVFDMQ